MKRKLTSLITLLCFALTLWPVSAFAEPIVQEQAPTGTVRLIVELEAPSVLESANEVTTSQNTSTQDYLASKSADSDYKEVVAGQKAILSQIASLEGSGVATSRNGSAETAEVSLTPLYTYTHAVNGFVIEADASLMDDIKALDGVKSVSVAQTYTIAEPIEGNATQSTASYAPVDDTNARVLQDQGIKGQGQVVAVIDSELDCDHEFFSGEVESPSLSKGEVEFFLKNGFLNISSDTALEDVYRSSKLPYVFNYASQSADTYPSDEDSAHGTHVAGIAVGRGGTRLDGTTFDGVAPEAQLVFMAVSAGGLDLDGAAATAALDDAVKLGANTINMSYGTSCGASANATEARAFDNVVKSDIYLSVAASNAARSTTTATEMDNYTTGCPAVYDASTAVASVDASSVQLEKQNLSIEGHDAIPYLPSNALSFGEAFGDTYYDTVYVNLGKKEDLKDKDLTGKIAVIDRGEITFAEKCENAQAAGAVGVIIRSDNDILAQSSFISPDLIPTICVTKAAGEALLDGVRVKGDTEAPSVTTETSSSTMSGFSSWGAQNSLVLKPDITATGGAIYSSYPSKEDNVYQLFDGTSMAAPTLAGCATLMRQYLKENASRYPAVDVSSGVTQRIENLMMSTATILTQEDGVQVSPRQQGAGLVNLEAATETPVILLGDGEKSKISLGSDLGNTFTLHATAVNLTDKDVTYDKVSVSVITDGADEDGNLTDMRALATTKIDAPESVTVPAGGSVPIEVTVTLDKSDVAENLETFTNGFFVDGYISLSNDTNPSVHLPYMGYYGDWAAQTGLDQPFLQGGRQEFTGLTSNYAANISIYLGTNYFCKLLFGLDANLSGNEDYVAISPNGDYMFDDLMVAVTPLRQMQATNVVIKDSQGQVIFRDTFTGTNTLYKNTTNYLTINQDVIDGLEDGSYTLTATAKNDVTGSKNESITMPFKVDRVSPKCNSWEVSGESLNINLTDNVGVMYAIAVAQNADGENYTDYRQTYEDDTPEDTTLTFDLTGFDKDSVVVEFMDYAGNTYTLCGTDGRAFLDTPKDAWYYDDVLTIRDCGLMTGTDDSGHFSPQSATTRGQLVTILYRLAGEPDTEKAAGFSDVTDDAYYATAVAWAAENDIVRGFEDGTFRPNEALAREQMAAMLVNYAKYDGQDVSKTADLSGYSDVDKDSWSYESLAWAKEAGLLTGTTATTLSPRETATRAQMATILARYIAE